MVFPFFVIPGTSGGQKLAEPKFLFRQLRQPYEYTTRTT